MLVPAGLSPLPQAALHPDKRGCHAAAAHFGPPSTGAFMKATTFLAPASALLALALAAPARAQTDIQWWHSMTAVNGEWVNDLAKEFNASQKEYRVVPTYKGSY